MMEKRKAEGRWERKRRKGWDKGKKEEKRKLNN